MTLDATIRAVQSKVGVTVDGNPGPQTWAAIHRTIVGEATSTSIGKLADERSERAIVRGASPRGSTISDCCNAP